MKKNLDLNDKNITVIMPSERLYTREDLKKAFNLGRDYEVDTYWGVEHKKTLDTIFPPPPQNTTYEPQG